MGVTLGLDESIEVGCTDGCAVGKVVGEAVGTHMARLSSNITIGIETPLRHDSW